MEDRMHEQLNEQCRQLQNRIVTTDYYRYERGHAKINIYHWLQKLKTKDVEIVQKQNRKQYLKLIYIMCLSRIITEPFNHLPPEALPFLKKYQITHTIKTIDQKVHKQYPLRLKCVQCLSRIYETKSRQQQKTIIDLSIIYQSQNNYRERPSLQSQDNIRSYNGLQQNAKQTINAYKRQNQGSSSLACIHNQGKAQALKTRDNCSSINHSHNGLSKVAQDNKFRGKQNDGRRLNENQIVKGIQKATQNKYKINSKWMDGDLDQKVTINQIKCLSFRSN